MDIKNTVSFIRGERIQLEPIVKSVVEGDKRSFVVNKVEAIKIDEVDEAIEQSAIENSSDVQKKNIEKALTDVTQFFQAEQRKLSFSVSDATKEVVIEVKDAETNEILRQIPPEFVVRLAEHLDGLSGESNDSSGFLLRDKA
jgi:flagellar protein FlaG